jgi:hypothetical protein
MAQLKQKAVKIELPKPREAGEGVDQSAWSAYVPIPKKNEEKKKAPAPASAPVAGAKEVTTSQNLIIRDVNMKHAAWKGEKEGS